ncbi:rhamnulokinase [Luteolibacter soli]|uniref:Rhamnulokinase family protein n=1 Tax=Luteolibacter soli TaxID=3135280 RepID=A0ABU9AXI3_9BACT
MPVFLSIDLGAGSGRVIAGVSDLKTLQLEEIHRFDNPGTDLPGGSYWNIVGLFRDIVEGLRRAVEKYGKDIVAIGIDTWGCDFGLLDGHGRLLGMPHQYRDARHEGMPAVMHAKLSEAEIYSLTGITTNFYNSSLHLLAEEQVASPALAAADTLLFIPDLLAFWLCGVQAVERTIASTSQLLDAGTGDWAWGVIETLGLPRRIFGKIVSPGTVLGPIRKEVARQIGMEGIPVVASASHDTASAVAGIPMEGDDALWLSSGTWSIMGLERKDPIRTPQAFAARCCNELGVENSVRFLKNIAGLWLIQECKRQWTLDGESISYGEMAKLAEAAPAFTAFIDPDDPVFAAPGEMPTKIRAWCERTGQAVPKDKGTILRVASESLALKYRVVFENFCALADKRFEQLHAGGGGIQNAFLAQATADALGIDVIAGPIEATSCGNIVVQMIATGHLPDLAAARHLIRESFEFQNYAPKNGDEWQGAYERFKAFIGR